MRPPNAVTLPHAEGVPSGLGESARTAPVHKPGPDELPRWFSAVVSGALIGPGIR